MRTRSFFVETTVLSSEASAMNLLFIQKSTGRGGAKNSLLESVTAIRGDHQVHSHVIIGEPGPFSERCTQLGVPFSVERLPEWRKFLDRIFFSQHIRRISKKHSSSKIDWVISNEMWWGPHAAQIARDLGCRSAVILRDGIATIKKARQYRLVQHELVLPVSSTIADTLRGDIELKSRVHVLFNAVNVPPPRPGDEAELNYLLAPFTKVGRWLLVVGKLTPRKNQADAVRILRALRDAGHSDLGLLLAGDVESSYRETMSGIIRECRLDGEVAMIGNFDGLATLIHRAVAVLLPSLREGLPRSLVEAITCGKPAYSYPCEGVDDIFAEHRGHFVSRKSQPDSLTEVLLDSWTSPAKSAPIFSAVRTSVLSRFSSEAHRERFHFLLST